MSKKGQLTKADYLPYDEFIDFLNELRKDKQYKWEAFATIAFATALRGGDVVMLKWCDVLDKDKIVINVENPLKVVPLIHSNLTPVKFSHSPFCLFLFSSYSSCPLCRVLH